MDINPPGIGQRMREREKILPMCKCIIYLMNKIFKIQATYRPILQSLVYFLFIFLRCGRFPNGDHSQNFPERGGEFLRPALPDRMPMPFRYLS